MKKIVALLRSRSKVCEICCSCSGEEHIPRWGSPWDGKWACGSCWNDAARAYAPRRLGQYRTI